MMLNHTPRLVIYAQDITKITGMSLRSSWRLLHKIRHQLKRAPGSFITIEEFCDYTKIDERRVRQFLF